MTAECKVPAAAVDIPTEGGCGVSGPFDYEYANSARHESKAGERQRGREKSDRSESVLSLFFFSECTVNCVFHWALFRRLA